VESLPGLDHYLTTDPRDRERPGPVPKYRCTECPKAGLTGTDALEHHITTGHAVRGRDWGPGWPNAIFPCCPHEAEQKKSA
jgi:hypothetical protein